MIISEKPTYHTIVCHCTNNIQFKVPHSTDPTLKIKCHLCKHINSLNSKELPEYLRHKSSKQSAKKFSKGTDEAPLSTEYYDILEVDVSASQSDIKKSYYKLAMKYHPDKNSSPEAAEKFKTISDVYQILSDAKLRKRYNEYGPQNNMTPEGGFVDPSDFFKQCFGGDKFVDLIGELSLGKEFKNMMDENEEGDNKTAVEDSKSAIAEKKKIQEEKNQQRRKETEERVNKLAENLTNRIKIAKESSIEKLVKDTKFEAEELKHEPYGVELLNFIGSIYTMKGRRTLDNLNSTKFLSFARDTRHSIKDTYQTLSETYSAIKSGYQLQKTGQMLQDPESKLDDKTKAQLETEFATKGLNLMWLGSKLELGSILKQVCDKVLGSAENDKNEVRFRAEVMVKIGHIFQAVKPDSTDVQNPSSNAK